MIPEMAETRENNDEAQAVENKESITDSQLLERYRQGEEWAFKELVSRYKNSLYSFLRRFVNQEDIVEDVFQETFLLIDRHL